MRKLTHQEFRLFERDGVVVLKDVMSQEHIAGLRSAVDARMRLIGKTKTGYDLQAVADQVFDMKYKIEAGTANRFDLDVLPAQIAADPEARRMADKIDTPKPGRFFYEAGCWRLSKPIRQAVFDSALPELVADLVDADDVLFFEDTIFARDPHTPQQTAWHQDLDYFNVGDEGRKVIVWIPLDACDAETGRMKYVRGSHKWGETYAANVFFTSTPMSGSEEQRLPDIGANEDAYDIVSFDVNPGDVIIHDVMTLHGASGNTSARPRRAISFRYVDGDVRYFERPGAVTQTGISHTLKNGDPLLCDDYPLAFHRAWEQVAFG